MPYFFLVLDVVSFFLFLAVIKVESGELNLTFPLMFNPVTWDAHAFPVYFGGTKLTEDNLIISVPAIQLVYFVTSDTKRQDERYICDHNLANNNL